MNQLRESYNSKTIETQDLFRTMLRMKSEGKQGVFGLISDQTPRADSTRYWTKFMNQDTTVLVGAEQLASKFKYPLAFLNIERVKRGYYRCSVQILVRDNKEDMEYELTEKFTRILEAKINERPEFWLWSHNRWKYKKPE
jgi:KDO2-lipid IV(A) lauroyltransferase